MTSPAYTTEPEVLAALMVDGKADLALGPFSDASLTSASSPMRRASTILYSEMIPDDGVAMAVCKGNQRPA